MKQMVIIAIALIAIMMVAGAYLVLAQSKQTNLACSSCNNKCTAESNCGSPNCGAVNGGACTCNKSSGCGSCNGDCGGNCGLSGCSATTSATKTCGCSK
jgi:hypothetical protein